MAAISAPSSTSGSSAAANPLGVTFHRPEQPHPAEFRELGLVRVEHEVAGIPERGFENRAFALTQHQRVGRLAWRERRAGAEHVEEHPVKVQAVQEIELGDVDQIDTGEPTDLHAYGLLHVSLIHISEPTRLLSISYAVFCLK